MAISEKELLEAGFSKSEVDNLQGRLAAGGVTMQHLIDALLRRFRVSVWITVALVLVMLVTLLRAMPAGRPYSHHPFLPGVRPQTGP